MQLGNNYRAFFKHEEHEPEEEHKGIRRVTRCIIKDAHGNVIAEGEASCNHKDTYCRKTGREVAWKKAMAYLATIPEGETEPRMNKTERSILWNGFNTLPDVIKDGVPVATGRTRFGRIKDIQQGFIEPA